MGGGQADAGCEDTPAPWWCIQDAAPSDALLVDAGKPELDKPDGGDKPGGEKNSGWSGTINANGATYSFARFNDVAQTCGLSYEITELSDAEDCANCERAVDGVLGPVEIDIDEGGCGDAAERSGEMVGFGHSSALNDDGKNALKMRKDGGWFDLAGGSSGIFDEEWLFYHPATGGESPEPGGDAGKWLEGEVDTGSGVGFYRFYSSQADGTVLCEFNYPIANARPNESCGECLLARDMPLGPPDREVPGADCQFFAGLGGTTVTYGHTEAGGLMVLKNGVWSEVGGMSVIDDSTWRFSLELVF